MHLAERNLKLNSLENDLCDGVKVCHCFLSEVSFLHSNFSNDAHATCFVVDQLTGGA